MTLLHYVPRWLPPSEQFVHQLISRSAFRPVVAVRRGVVSPDAFPVRSLVRLDRKLALVPSSQERRAVAAALTATIRLKRSQLLHVHFGFEVEGIVGAAQKADVPLVLSLHGHDITGPVSPALKHALRHADAVVVPSGFLADKAISAGAVSVKVLPSGVDRRFFTPQPHPGGPPTVVFVGRFVEKKGLDVLAAAWPLVLAQVPDAHLLLLGDGPLEPDLPAERWHPDPNRRAEQVRTALTRATVVVTPSRTAADGDAESLLLVNLEAQACGRAVVTTRHGGILDAVEEGKSAIVVPEADPAALASALVEVLLDPLLSEQMGAHGVTVAARFDADELAGRVDDLYRELLP